MSLKFQQLVNRDQPYLQQSGQNYRTQISQKEQYSPERRQTRIQHFQFTYGNRQVKKISEQALFKQKSKKNILPAFDFQDEVANQTIAKELIQQNTRLKHQLIQSNRLIQQLSQELSICHDTIDKLSKKRPSIQQKQLITDLKNEILLILSQNKSIKEELDSIKRSVASSKYQGTVTNTYQNYQKYSTSNNYRTNRSKSHDLIKGYRNAEENTMSLTQSRKTQELLSSIKGMYFKIKGHKAESLKQLWRWLKGMGHFHSCFRKWRLRAEKYLSYSPLHTQDLMDLIQEALDLIE